MNSNQNSETIEDIIKEIRQDSTPYSAKVADELENQTIGNRVLLEDAATCLRDDELYIKGLANRFEAAATRAYNKIDSAVCGIDEASHFDIDDVRKVMNETIGDYYE